jgi:hypothetical protein
MHAWASVIDGFSDKIAAVGFLLLDLIGPVNHCRRPSSSDATAVGVYK